MRTSPLKIKINPSKLPRCGVLHSPEKFDNRILYHPIIPNHIHSEKLRTAITTTGRLICPEFRAPFLLSEWHILNNQL